MTKSYQIVVEKRANRELLRLPTSIRQRVNDAISALAHDPRPAGSRKLVGKREAWRIRVGEYRVIYEIQDQILRVLVVRIGHRRDIYR